MAIFDFILFSLQNILNVCSGDVNMKQSVDRLTIEKIAKDTIFKLKAVLIKNPNCSTKEETIAVTTHILEKAFSEIPAESFTTLYRQLAAGLHPDKLRHKEKELYQALNEINATEVPSSILNQFKNKPIESTHSGSVASKNFSATSRIIFNLIRSPFPTMFYGLKSVEDESKRYSKSTYQIIDSISRKINLGLYFASNTVDVLYAIPYLINLAFSSIHSSFINFITQGEYNKEVERYKKDPESIMEGKKRLVNGFLVPLGIASAFLQKRDKINEPFLSSNVDEVIDLFKKSLYVQSLAPYNPDTLSAKEQQTLWEAAEARVDKKIEPFIKPTGFKHLQVINVAFSNAIKNALPNGFYNKIAATVVKPLQILGLPLILATSALLESANIIIRALTLLPGRVAIFSAKFASLMALNAPLYSMDIYQKIKSWWNNRLLKGKEKTHESSYIKMITAGIDVQPPQNDIQQNNARKDLYRQDLSQPNFSPSLSENNDKILNDMSPNTTPLSNTTSLGGDESVLEEQSKTAPSMM